jgi:ADP-heptose:LPS heptosyltransferase
VARLRAAGARRVVAVNLGVGDNPRKRIGGDFERELVRGLLAPGTALVLDRGIGEEQARVGAIVDALELAGRSDVLVYEGPVAPLAALIRKSDLYVGYDSAFQHIAAALGVPVVDVFADVPSPVFADRWQPYSAASVRVVDLAARTMEPVSAAACVLEAARPAT